MDCAGPHTQCHCAPDLQRRLASETQICAVLLFCRHGRDGGLLHHIVGTGVTAAWRDSVKLHNRQQERPQFVVHMVVEVCHGDMGSEPDVVVAYDHGWLATPGIQLGQLSHSRRAAERMEGIVPTYCKICKTADHNRYCCGDGRPIDRACAPQKQLVKLFAELGPFVLSGLFPTLIVLAYQRLGSYRWGMAKRFWLTSTLLLCPVLAGCAHYEPRPLTVDPLHSSALQTPLNDILSRDAATITRPYLKPVALDLSAPLDPNAVAILAVIANPNLKAQRARAGVNDAQVFAAGLLPDPTFSFGVDHVLSGPDPFDNLAGALGFSLNALRTQKVQRAQAVAEARQVRLDLSWAEWQTACNARLQAVRVLALEQALANTRTSALASEALLARYLKAAGRGDISPDQVQSSRIAALDAQNNFRNMEVNLAAARSELHRLLGLPPDYALRLAPAVLPGPVPDADHLFALALADRSDLEALRSGYDAQEAAVRRAILDQFPNLDLTINGARDTGGNKLLGPSIAFTLPLWNRNRGGIAVANATREALHQEYDARLFQTRADIAAAVSGLTIARQQYEILRAGMPAIETFARASRRAAQRGDLALATADVAEQTLRDRQLLLLQSRQAIAEQTIALELLVGAPQESWPL